MCQTRIYLSASLFVQKIRRSAQVSYKLNHSVCFPKIFLRFFTKGVVQHQNGVMKYSSSAPVVESRKVFHANSLKTALYHRYFERIRPQVQSSAIEENISMTASWSNYFWRNSWIAASHRKLQRYIYFKNSNDYT